MVLIGLSILIGYITGVPSRILQNAADACDKPYLNPPPLGEDSPRSNRLVDWAIMTWITGFLLWLVTMSVTGNLGLLTANVGIYTLCLVAYVAALYLECPVATRMIIFFGETKKVNPEQDESMFVWVLPAGLIASAPLVFGHYLPWSWSSSLWCGALAGLTAVILYTTLAAISNRHLAASPNLRTATYQSVERITQMRIWLHDWWLANILRAALFIFTLGLLVFAYKNFGWSGLVWTFVSEVIGLVVAAMWPIQFFSDNTNRWVVEGLWRIPVWIALTCLYLIAGALIQGSLGNELALLLVGSSFLVFLAWKPPEAPTEDFPDEIDPVFQTLGPIIAIAFCLFEAAASFQERWRSRRTP